MSPPGMSEPRRGLVLGAGGVLGASWTIGALAAIEAEIGWDPRTAEVIVGTSAGSVLAAFLGNDIGVSSLINHQRGIVVPGDPVIDYDYGSSPLPPMPRLRFGSPALLLKAARHPRSMTPLAAVSSVLPLGRGSLTALGELVSAVAEPDAWAAHPATWVVATDYATGRRVVFGREGAPRASLVEAVMASCAIPGWYTPVLIDGRRYIDGGACSVTSLDLVADLGLDEVFVLSPMTSTDFDRPTTAIARLERYFRRVVTRRLIREAAKVRRSGTDVVVIHPGRHDLEAIGANLMDPRRREVVLDTSLETSAQSLHAQYGRLRRAG